MSRIANGVMGDPVESEIIEVMRKKDYSLDTVNNYGDNLLHMSAANGCYDVIKEILKNHERHDINLQNNCGWTPLMQAIRNGNVKAVKLLLENGYNPEQSTFEGISAIALSVAISREMFEIVYEACPSALRKSQDDRVNPLCVAALKNDKELFFRLIELGLEVSEAGDYTLLMMAQSTVPEIADLGEFYRPIENYWTEDYSNEDYESYSDEEFDTPQMSSTLEGTELSAGNHSGSKIEIPSICISPPENTTHERKFSDPKIIKFHKKIATRSLISPRLEYTRDQILQKSPNLCFNRKEIFREKKSDEESKVNHEIMDEELNHNPMDPSKNITNSDNRIKIYKFQLKRPPDLKILKGNSNDILDEKIEQISPNKTPMQPRYKTPPKQFALDFHQKKMAFLLKRFGLTQFIPTFLEQEVDLDLFLSLNDQDLQEIGIAKKSDRIILQSVIDECNRNKLLHQ